jgi:hypothetical protein
VDEQAEANRARALPRDGQEVPTSRFFVRSTELTGYTPARVGDAPAILRFGNIIGRVADVAGREAAALFTEPVLPRGANGLGSAISWYSSREGHVVELDSIDEVARKPIVDRLARRLDALSPALADPEIGPTLSTWLNIPSSKDILAIGDRFTRRARPLVFQLY